jgi:hypothetical protein
LNPLGQKRNYFVNRFRHGNQTVPRAVTNADETFS